ncbi:MAG: DegT/DnrJ/EryC1/StrS family aminotransferase [Burkholderiaceae bacterium]|nr:DegT/DnrJ/EryC1/StrS family aminotransferase [Burkholderiaceae bacterium]
MPCVLDLRQRRLVTSGRMAIGLALQAMGVQPGGRVLIPAYHSASMVPPALHLGARAEFYRVGADAAVDLDDLAARLPGASAVMVTHYFGFPQSMAPIRTLCDLHGVPLLEDCAHSLFGSHGGRPLGAWGDYAAASTMKFLPSFDGGCIASAHHRLDSVRLRSAGLLFEAKAAYRALERSVEHGRLRVAALLLALPQRALQALWRWRKRGLPPAQQQVAPAASDNGFDYDPQWLDKRSAWFSRALLALSSRQDLCRRRRRNYLALEQAVHGLPGCRPLHAALPEHAVPWVFPLLVDDPEPVFERLQAAGVPLVRFGQPMGAAADACANARDLAQRVLGLPCHQALSARELDAIVSALRNILAGTPP